jgi:signal transduction histidine kinase
LSVVYGIVKDHQGEIRVYSQPGEATRFEILLPTDSNVSVASQREMVA